MAHLEENLKWALGDAPTAGSDILIFKTLTGTYPNDARAKLADIFYRYAHPFLPRVFRYMFAGDTSFKKRMVDILITRFGVYEELNYNDILLPLPAEIPEERPAKRRRTGTPDVGLIQFD